MLKNLKLLLTLNKAAGQWNHIRKDIDSMDAKHLVASKTFWVNLFGLALTVADVLPQKWSLPVLAVANIGIRLVTDQPVRLFPASDKSVK